MLMNRAQSCLCVIDVQQRLAPAMHGLSDVIANCAILMKAAARLSVPALVSEQYPKGLGATVPELAEAACLDDVIEKISFSCHGEKTWRDTFADLSRPQAVLCGIETHICVLQTALDLRLSGTAVFVVADAVTSRTPESKAVALDRLRDNGVEIVTTEMVLFEWLEQAGTPDFKDISRMIK